VGLAIILAIRRVVKIRDGFGALEQRTEIFGLLGSLKSEVLTEDTPISRFSYHFSSVIRSGLGRAFLCLK
jgi:hypothetical protein